MRTEINYPVLSAPTRQLLPRSWSSTRVLGAAKPPWMWPSAQPLSGAHPMSVMGKLRHEEVKANVSKQEGLQALFAAVPRSCGSR